MAEEQGKELSKEDYDIGYTNGGEIMIVSIPLKKWADDRKHGDILVSGVFTKAERIALKNLQVMRVEKQQNGIVKPASPIMPGVH